MKAATAKNGIATGHVAERGIRRLTLPERLNCKQYQASTSPSTRAQSAQKTGLLLPNGTGATSMTARRTLPAVSLRRVVPLPPEDSLSRVALGLLLNIYGSLNNVVLM
ncbi:MAG: hypothetical protein ACK40A_14765, partial [Pannonibacter indicus]